jgi:alkylhydroperoxidase/carboxymuconolactone decarboxylase family protein YurZ
LPARYLRFQKLYPAVFEHYAALGDATQSAGPLTARTRALVKLALAVGGRLEGAVHSHTRRALEAGCTPEEIRQVVVLGTTTLGFPTMMAALSWVEDVLTPDEKR